MSRTHWKSIQGGKESRSENWKHLKKFVQGELLRWALAVTSCLLPSLAYVCYTIHTDHSSDGSINFNDQSSTNSYLLTRAQTENFSLKLAHSEPKQRHRWRSSCKGSFIYGWAQGGSPLARHQLDERPRLIAQLQFLPDLLFFCRLLSLRCVVVFVVL